MRPQTKGQVGSDLLDLIEAYHATLAEADTALSQWAVIWESACAAAEAQAGEDWDIMPPSVSRYGKTFPAGKVPMFDAQAALSLACKADAARQACGWDVALIRADVEDAGRVRRCLSLWIDRAKMAIEDARTPERRECAGRLQAFFEWCDYLNNYEEGLVAPFSSRPYYSQERPGFFEPWFHCIEVGFEWCAIRAYVREVSSTLAALEGDATLSLKKLLRIYEAEEKELRRRLPELEGAAASMMKRAKKKRGERVTR